MKEIDWYTVYHEKLAEREEVRRRERRAFVVDCVCGVLLGGAVFCCFAVWMISEGLWR